jgi:ketosteroid isomerase-like protein
MSQENVEVARRFEEAIDARVVPHALLAPDFEWFPATMATVERGSYRGPEGLAAYFQVVSETWQQMRLIIEEVRDLGDQVLVLGRLQARGLGSGVPVDEPIAIVHRLRDGLITGVRAYLDRAEALNAVGLEE